MRRLLGLALLAPAAFAPAAELGRLFKTPAERAAIDAARAGDRAAALEPAPAPQPALQPQPVAPPDVPRIAVDGIVRRGDGRSVAWVNGQNTLTGDFAANHFDVRVRGGTVAILAPAPLPEVSLRPGQAYEPGTRQIVDIAKTRPP
jgi:hypothetical protein